MINKEKRHTCDSRIIHVSTPSNPDVNGVVNRLQAVNGFPALGGPLGAELLPFLETKQRFICPLSHFQYW